LEVVFYLVAVVAFCVVNWLLLKAEDTQAPEVNKSFENMILEEMLRNLPPRMKPETNRAATASLNLGVSSEQSLKLESWMLQPEAFRRPGTESELRVEDWMLSTESWLKD
jgi:hypothetical protein